MLPYELWLSHPQDYGGTFDFSRDYAWQEQLYGLEGRPPDPVLADGAASGRPRNGDDGGAGGHDRHFGPQWAYLRLSQPVTATAVCRGAAAHSSTTLTGGHVLHFLQLVALSVEQPA
jgi:hypothetical protein